MTALITLLCIPYIALWLKNTKPFLYATVYALNIIPITKGKPFNCVFCISFWLTSIIYWFYQPDWIAYIAVCLTAAILGWLYEVNYLSK